MRGLACTCFCDPCLISLSFDLQDHFLEEDTTEHCWEALAKLFEDGCTDGIICDFGMPVMHHGTRYNCRVMALDRRILLIRPKLFLANDGNYRETRWFTRWQHGWVLQDFVLPPVIIAATRGEQRSAPIGPGMLQLNDTIIAAETWLLSLPASTESPRSRDHGIQSPAPAAAPAS